MIESETGSYCPYRITNQTLMLPAEKEALPLGGIPNEGLCSASDPRYKLCHHPLCATEECPEGKGDWCQKSWAR